MTFLCGNIQITTRWVTRESGKETEEDCERSLGLCGLPIITAIPIHNKKQSICANKNAALKVLERTDNDNDAARLVMVMTMLSSRSVGWRGWETETESWEWNGIYICIWKRRFWDKLNFQEVAAQLSMNKFTTPQSSEVHRHWRVVLESKSIILIDARPSRCSRCRNFCCSIMPSICDLFGSFCAVHSVSAGSPLCRHCLLPLPLLSWYFSCFPEFFSVSVFAVWKLMT